MSAESTHRRAPQGFSRHPADAFIPKVLTKCPQGIQLVPDTELDTGKVRKFSVLQDL